MEPHIRVFSVEEEGSGEYIVGMEWIMPEKQFEPDKLRFNILVSDASSFDEAAEKAAEIMLEHLRDLVGFSQSEAGER